MKGANSVLVEAEKKKENTHREGPKFCLSKSALILILFLTNYKNQNSQFWAGEETPAPLEILWLVSDKKKLQGREPNLIVISLLSN